MNDDYNTNEFDAFICYETKTGAGYATHLKDSLSILSINCFVAAEGYDIPIGEEEKLYRYKIIRECKFFILIMTNLTFLSEEVKNEIDEALRNEKKIIICLDSQVDSKHFEQEFPKIANKQRLPSVTDKYELAKAVTDWFQHLKLLEKGVELESKPNTSATSKKSLIIEPRWSVQNISQLNTMGHIIFKLINNTDTKIFVYGYKMFRINPDRDKDFYYFRHICKAEELTKWISDQHFKIIFWPNDEHIFHWHDVDISKTYGINEKGAWGTEVQIAYLEAGNEDDLLYAIGNTSIQYV